MSEATEAAPEARLADFRMKIKSLVEKRGATNATLAGVVNVNELGIQEQEMWDAYGHILKEIVGENVDYASLAKQGFALGKESTARIRKKDRPESVNDFYNWLNSQLGVVAGNAGLIAEDHTFKDEIMPDFKKQIDEFFGS